MITNINYDTVGLRTISLKVDCPQTQCDTSPLDPNTVSLRLMDLRTVTDCPEDSVSQLFVLLKHQSKHIQEKTEVRTADEEKTDR